MHVNDPAQEIEDVAWQACKALKSIVELPLSIQYALTLLLLKLLLDKTEDDSTTSQETSSPPGARIVVPRDWGAKHIFPPCTTQDLGRYIDSVLSGLERENPIALGGVSRHISFRRLTASLHGERAISFVVILISQLDMRPSRLANDSLAKVYESLLERLSSSVRRGEFDTPKNVATLVARLIAPPSHCSIYDPACKRGSMLTAIAREFGSDGYLFSGQEGSVGNWSACKLGMLMYGIHDADIRCSDSLEDPITDDSGRLRKYDVVISNPPFGMASWGKREAQYDPFGRFSRGVPPKSRSDYAFLLHMIESAKEGTGEVAALLPLGALFRQGVERSIRQSIVEEGLVRCVVVLPANLFYGAGISVALLLLSKRREKTDILFVDASREFGSQAGRNYLRDEHVDKIVAAVREFETNKDYCYKASIEEVRSREYDLSVGRYVQEEPRGTALSVADIEKEIREAEEDLSLVRQDLRSSLDDLLNRR